MDDFSGVGSFKNWISNFEDAAENALESKNMIALALCKFSKEVKIIGRQSPQTSWVEWKEGCMKAFNAGTDDYTRGIQLGQVVRQPGEKISTFVGRFLEAAELDPEWADLEEKKKVSMICGKLGFEQAEWFKLDEPLLASREKRKFKKARS